MKKYWNRSLEAKLKPSAKVYTRPVGAKVHSVAQARAIINRGKHIWNSQWKKIVRNSPTKILGFRGVRGGSEIYYVHTRKR